MCLETLDQQICSKKVIPSKAPDEDGGNKNDRDQSINFVARACKIPPQNVSDVPLATIVPDFGPQAYCFGENGSVNGRGAALDAHDSLRNTTGYRQISPEPSRKTPYQSSQNIVKSMEKAEAEEKVAYKSLKQHRDSYEKQLQEYIKLNPEMAFQVYEERFSPEFFLRGHLAAKRHSEAEKAAKECRREAHEAGLPHVNEENQRSGFHTGIGEGLGYHDESEMGVELSKHKRIDEWLGAPEKTCKLDPKEREYAFSGGHVELWESVSLHERNLDVRRKIERYGAGNGRVGGGAIPTFKAISRGHSEPPLG
ncbi:hypothetical protein PTMSG1_09480 [Pyrenophora teres f. maculata]|nr:hypothetical protein PTMSG1_09480 [Pyrenophora teres f. maculata]